MPVVPDWPFRDGVISAADLLGWISDQLAAGNLNNSEKSRDNNAYRLDARLLLGLALGGDEPVFPHQDVEAGPGLSAALMPLIERRLKSEPVSRLRGWREFYSLRFELNADTLDPRADSETLVAAAIEWLSGDGNRGSGHTTPPRVIDFGTGSGCLLLSVLAHCPDASGLGVDISDAAIRAARNNAMNLGLGGRARFACTSWDDGVEGRFDAVLSNPPYIPAGDIPGLMPEVRMHDPLRALDGGEDGLDAWRELLPATARRLNPGGRAFVEIGAGQQDAVADLAGKSGLSCLNILPDLAGIGRCLILGHDQRDRAE